MVLSLVRFLPGSHLPASQACTHPIFIPPHSLGQGHDLSAQGPEGPVLAHPPPPQPGSTSVFLGQPGLHHWVPLSSGPVLGLGFQGPQGLMPP